MSSKRHWEWSEEAGIRLRELRRAKGWGQRKLSLAIGMTRNTIMFTESGQVRMTLAVWCEALLAMGYDPCEQLRSVVQQVKEV